MALNFESNIENELNTWEDLSQHPKYRKNIRKFMFFIILLSGALVFKIMQTKTETTFARETPIVEQARIRKTKNCFYDELVKNGLVNGKINFKNNVIGCKQ